MIKTKFLKIFLVILGIVTICAIGYVAWRINKDIEKVSKEATDFVIQKEKPEAEERKSLKTEINISDWKVYRNEEYGFEIKYPDDWNRYKKRSDLIILSPSGEKSDIELEHVGDIVVEIFQKDKNISLKEFHLNRNESYLYTDAMQGYDYFQVKGMEAIKFKGVLGMVPNTIVSLNAGNEVIRITDVNENHQKDGVFDKIVFSIEFLKH